jgi:GNAT superfamily N-acetyltransferase
MSPQEASGMGWCTTSNLEEFLTAADAHLKSRPLENALLLTVAEDLRAASANAGGSVFGWLEQGDAVRGAFIHTPSRPLLTGVLAPEAAAVLADSLSRQPRQVAAIDAASPAADAFAMTWTLRTGQLAQVHRHTRVYRLTNAAPGGPGMPGPPGALRVADSDDRAVVAKWLTEFGNEVGDLSGTPDAAAGDLVRRGCVRLWESGVEGPVGMAVVTRPVAGASRVSLVYTPPGLRHHGYASAILAAASEAARQEGATEVVLITDVSSPLVGILSHRLGCEPVADRLVLSFAPARVPARS